MKLKTPTLILAALFGIVFLTVGVLTAANLPANFPDTVIIQSKGYRRVQKGPVKFDHKKHAVGYKIACTECHHVYKDGKNIWKEGDPVQPCSACHDPNKRQGKAMKLELAFHKNCRDCHKIARRQGKKAPTIRCNDCHGKKK